MRSNNKKNVTTSHWGAFRVYTDNGRIVKVKPFEEDPNPSKIPYLLPKAIYHESRVKNPFIRKGWLEGGKDRNRSKRGKDSYVEIPWNEALDIAANEIDRIKKEFGNESIYGGSYGWGSAGRFNHCQSQIHRFLNSLGGYVSSFGSYSTGAAQTIIPHIFGINLLDYMWSYQPKWPVIEKNTEILLMFGGINPKNSQVSMGGITKHTTEDWLNLFYQQGKELINISPQKNDSIVNSNWLKIIPGTDTALMLGIAYYLEKNNLTDKIFLSQCTTGYDVFRTYLLGESDNLPKSPNWASKICGIDSNIIIELAQSISKKRTLITCAWSLQRGENGEQPFWMAATLASMVGQVGLPGGGVGFGYGAIGGIGVSVSNLKGLTLPQGVNRIDDVIPVARISDMLLHPNGLYNFNGQKKRYPLIKLIYWCGGNPFHHHQDLNRLVEAWKCPDTIIVNEPWWTASAKHADIVFPATTPYEREDVSRAQGDTYLFYMPKFIEPVGESKDDYIIFSELSKRLGIFSEFTEGKDSIEWIKEIYEAFRKDNVEFDIPDFETLQNKNWVELPIKNPKTKNIPFSKFRESPKKYPLSTQSGVIEIYSKRISSFKYKDCTGHPRWVEPSEWLSEDKIKEGFFHMVSPQPHDKLHSQLECAISDKNSKVPSQLTINHKDAEKRSINNDDILLIHNERGKCLGKAKVSDAIKEGVVSLPTGAWFELDDNGIDIRGNPNTLTKDKGTSNLGQGCSAHTTLVKVDKFFNC